MTQQNEREREREGEEESVCVCVRVRVFTHWRRTTKFIPGSRRFA